jgi:hypothetical protein
MNKEIEKYYERKIRADDNITVKRVVALNLMSCHWHCLSSSTSLLYKLFFFGKNKYKGNKPL